MIKNLDTAKPGDEVFDAKGESVGFIIANGDIEISVKLDKFPHPLRLDKSRQKRTVPSLRVPVDAMKAVVGDTLFFHKQWRTTNG